jgi:hypothetical protein
MTSRAAWDLFLAAFEPVFTLPSFVLFCQLVSAWVLCPGRHTVTRMLGMIEPRRRRPHDAYHRFLRAAAWSPEQLWRLLAHKLVASLVSPGDVLLLDLDDTLFHKAGRKVDGAGVFRDAVRSTRARVVYALGLNLVVLTLRVKPAWGGEPLGLPLNLRLYRKGGPSHLDLAEATIRQLAGWLPDREFALSCDGAYASLAGRSLPRTHVTSRMRRDAALFELPPPRRPKRRGRPRKRGRRLPTPEAMARRSQGWTRKTVDIRGRLEKRLLCARRVLWYSVCPDRQVLLVIVRDPTGRQRDDFFFTTNLDDTAETVVTRYAGRWSIEDTFRNVKQFLGGEDPQTWKHHGPERAAALSFWIYSAVWHWYLTTQGTRVSWPSLPWYQSKKTPSFADALAALRRTLWGNIFSRSGPRAVVPKTVSVLIEALARAA